MKNDRRHQIFMPSIAGHRLRRLGSAGLPAPAIRPVGTSQTLVPLVRSSAPLAYAGCTSTWKDLLTIFQPSAVLSSIR